MEEAGKEKSGKLRTVVVTVLLVLALGAMATTLVLPLFGRTTPSARETQGLAKLQRVLFACRAYAADHGGAYPPDLAALHPVYLDEEGLLGADDGKGGQVPLIYTPGLTSSSPPDSIVIEHPIRFTPNRVVGTAGGFVRRLPEDAPGCRGRSLNPDPLPRTDERKIEELRASFDRGE